MKTPFAGIAKNIYRISIVIIMLSALCFTMGRLIPIEFSNAKHQESAILVIMAATVLSIVSTLFGTLRKAKSIGTRTLVILSTFVTASLVGWIFMLMLYTVYWGAWESTDILYRNKNSGSTIQVQIYDAGALGYGNSRIVLIKPFLHYFRIVTAIDTSTVDKQQWHGNNGMQSPARSPQHKCCRFH